LIKDNENSNVALVVTILFVIVAIAGFAGFSYYRLNKIAHENYTKAQDAFRNSDLSKAEKLLNIKPSKDMAEDFYKLKYNVQMNQNKLYEAEQTAKELIKLNPKMLLIIIY